MDGAGNLYVADPGNSTIRKIVMATGAVTTIVGTAGQAGVKLGPLPGRLNQPYDIAVSPVGTLYIVGQAEDVILEVH